MPKPKALYVLSTRGYDLIFKEAAAEIAELVDVYASPQTKESVAKDPSLLGPMEVLLTGWGGPTLEEAFLSAVPRLKAVIYASGSIRPVVTEAFWERSIPITSAWDCNATPVAEYVLAQVFCLLKKVWHYAFESRGKRAWPQRVAMPGGCGSTVGVISLGLVGRRVCRLLQPFDLKVLAYDPYARPADAGELRVELVSLEDIFRRSDVVTLHAPTLKETTGMITGEHFRMMKEGASFINTSRGVIVRQEEMIEVLKSRPDIWAVLDVTNPEPPVAGSAIFSLPNVIVTPHVAGPYGNECRRNGRYAIGELKRFLAGRPFEWAIDRKRAAILA